MSDRIVADCLWTGSEIDSLDAVYVSPPVSPLGQWKGFGWEHFLERCDSVMDYNDPLQRRYPPNPYATAPQEHEQQQRLHRRQRRQHGVEPTTDHFDSSSPIERFRHAASLQETPPSTGRAGQDPHVYSFAQVPQFGSVTADAQAMHYATDMQTPDAQRPPDASDYNPYGSTSVYGLGQGPSQHQTSQLQYDPLRYRISAPSDSMVHQSGMTLPLFGNYYLTGQSGPSSAPLADYKYAQMPSQYALSNPYGQAGTAALSTQTESMFDPSTPGVFPGYGQEAPTSAQEPTSNVQEVFRRYQEHLRAIFSHVHDQSLQDAGRMLLEVTCWLLDGLEPLRLCWDEETTRQDHMEIWNLFNRAWLVTLQAQYDLTQEMLQTQQVRPVLPLHELEHLGSELVSVNDRIEKWGVIDYQMGVAEEEIMDRESSISSRVERNKQLSTLELTAYTTVLLRCIALVEPRADDPPLEDHVRDPPMDDEDDDPGFAESSAAAAARGR